MLKSTRKTRKNKKFRSSRTLDGKAVQLGYNSFKDYFNSAHWANYREECRDGGLLECCIACEYANAEPHHVNYNRLGSEELWDTIPLCNRCHTDVHRKGAAMGMVMADSHLILQKIWSWSDQETWHIFRYYLPHWNEEKKTKVTVEQARGKILAAQKYKDAAKQVSIESSDTYEKTRPKLTPSNVTATLSKNFTELRTMHEQGVSTTQMAKKFDIGKKDVEAFISKYKQYFK